MKNRKPPATDIDMVHAVADLFNEVGPETPEEVDTTLREAGYDPDQVAARMKAIAERALASSPLNWRNRAQVEMQKEAARLGAFKPTTPTSRTDTIAAIKQLLAKLEGSQVGLATAHYRNLEKATDDDLADLLFELEYLASHQTEPDDEAEI